MKLNILIILKFVLQIGGIAGILFIVMPLYDSHHELMSENERLRTLNRFYEQLGRPEFSDPKNQLAIRENIAMYKPPKKDIENEFDYSDRITTLIVFLALYYGMLNGLDTKIENLKITANNKQELS
ncbi:hypothetical protein KJK34_14110 [Flavobacterium sp. D11R37]|uniref:hypothetical protein n=1 Tax=Flavobacterium coralii TaxID=2838017 RepID=UPI001CA6BA48|nr:hypothetical protein [Flavobacterium coralii]MBY8963890.1 hypothetical protein [Flavobacterium coralii]